MGTCSFHLRTREREREGERERERERRRERERESVCVCVRERETCLFGPMTPAEEMKTSESISAYDTWCCQNVSDNLMVQP